MGAATLGGTIAFHSTADARRDRGAAGVAIQHGAIHAEALPLDATDVVNLVGLAP
jgi:hypothetical protein